jgi:hypothetical protein
MHQIERVTLNISGTMSAMQSAGDFTGEAQAESERQRRSGAMCQLGELAQAHTINKLKDDEGRITNVAMVELANKILVTEQATDARLIAKAKTYGRVVIEMGQNSLDSHGATVITLGKPNFSHSTRT